ncbi:IclR family transcriptional regulator domain-containing protein [Aureimonas populi]|uniref:IclR family transcriptional regulator C-terminal domain-containing protein n=1 Tax=Aureimonas populi TaxID=1701758 RepID=A0ABW5CMT7_9HYPH|nr:IclR family transcriptional regulator C-terminal domain-containing protein [Aureimonas populi]
MPRVNRTPEESELVRTHGPEYLELLARALRLIVLFNAEHREMTLNELAALSGMPRSSVRRVVLTLETLGMAEQNDRYFRLTPRVLTLAAAYLRSNSFADKLQPITDHVSARVGEACSVAVLDGDEAVMIVRTAPRRIVTVALEIGLRLPAYCSAVGRVLLGGMDEAELDAYLARLQPRKMTPATVTDKAALKARVTGDRAQGYSLVDHEAEQGFRSLAVPILDRDGRIACSLHIGMSAERTSIEQALEEYLPVLREASAEAALVIAV